MKNLEQFIQDKEVPGLQYAAVSPEGTVHEYCGGAADIKNGKPMYPETTLMSYSVTKTITAAAVLGLVEDGQLDLDEPAGEYLPEFPYGYKILIRHLLSQTSGLPNSLPLRWAHLVEEHEFYDEKKALAAVLNAHPKTSFKPGDRYAYSNLSYWLLGSIVANVSGMPFEKYVKSRIFEPLGITEDEMSFSILYPTRHAKGYLKKWSLLNLGKGLFTDSEFWGEYENGWLEILPHYVNGAAFGGIIGTARGFGKFLLDQLALRSKILEPSTTALFYKQQKNNRGKLVETTLGWHVGRLKDARYFFKQGGGAGYRAEIRLYPEKQLGSVILANSASFDTGKALAQVDPKFYRTAG